MNKGKWTNYTIVITTIILLYLFLHVMGTYIVYLTAFSIESPTIRLFPILRDVFIDHNSVLVFIILSNITILVLLSLLYFLHKERICNYYVNIYLKISVCRFIFDGNRVLKEEVFDILDMKEMVIKSSRTLFIILIVISYIHYSNVMKFIFDVIAEPKGVITIIYINETMFVNFIYVILLTMFVSNMGFLFSMDRKKYDEYINSNAGYMFVSDILDIRK
ncbi:membrane protein of unknown function [Magnetospira sp. QH-2]|nr:membrane protein of unknown function [Magnetospira sp. QH-2]